MKIFLDFDDTLLNTQELIHTLASSFETFGISLEAYHTAYEKVRATLGKGEKSYDFDAHLKELSQDFSFDTQKARAGVEEVLSRMEQFLFPDVIPFLEWCQNQKYSLYLVSFGSAEFQEKKVKAAGLEKYFEEVSVGPQGKDEEIAKILSSHPVRSGESIWFVDDRLPKIEEVKKHHEFIQTILMQRAEGRYPGEKNGYCNFLVHNFEEVEKIIQSKM